MKIHRPVALLEVKQQGMDEDMAVFKGYLRAMLRQLKLLKEAIHNWDFEKAEVLIDELIEDAQKNLED